MNFLKKIKTNKLPLIVICIIVVPALVVGYFLFLKPDSNTKENTLSDDGKYSIYFSLNSYGGSKILVIEDDRDFYFMNGIDNAQINAGTLSLDSYYKITQSIQDNNFTELKAEYDDNSPISEPSYWTFVVEDGRTYKKVTALGHSMPDSLQNIEDTILSEVENAPKSDQAEIPLITMCEIFADYVTKYKEEYPSNYDSFQSYMNSALNIMDTDYYELESRDEGEEYFIKYLLVPDSANIDETIETVRNNCPGFCDIHIYDTYKAYQLEMEYTELSSSESEYLDKWKAKNFEYLAEHKTALLIFDVPLTQYDPYK